MRPCQFSRVCVLMYILIRVCILMYIHIWQGNVHDVEKNRLVALVGCRIRTCIHIVYVFKIEIHMYYVYIWIYIYMYIYIYLCNTRFVAGFGREVIVQQL